MIKDFTGDVIPYMFETPETAEMLIMKLAKSGIGGWCLVIILFAIPLATVIYPRLKKGSGTGSARPKIPTG